MPLLRTLPTRTFNADVVDIHARQAGVHQDVCAICPDYPRMDTRDVLEVRGGGGRRAETIVHHLVVSAEQGDGLLKAWEKEISTVFVRLLRGSVWFPAGFLIVF